MAPFPKIHSLVIARVFAKNFIRKRVSPRPLLGAARKALSKTRAWQSGFASIWRTRQCTHQAGALTIGEPDRGKVVSESLADSLFSKAD